MLQRLSGGAGSCLCFYEGCNLILFNTPGTRKYCQHDCRFTGEEVGSGLKFVKPCQKKIFNFIPKFEAVPQLLTASGNLLKTVGAATENEFEASSICVNGTRGAGTDLNQGGQDLVEEKIGAKRRKFF